MEQTGQNNPAGRLHAILSRALQESSVQGQKNGVGLWAAVFDIKLSTPLSTPASVSVLREIVSRLLQFDKLIDETEASLRRIEGLPDRYFRPFARIRVIPQYSLSFLSSDIASTINTITEGDMTVLEFCSERLEQQHAERIVDERELAQILEDVGVLFNDVQQSDLDSELKTFILDGLESIRRGIYEFKIRGQQRLKETLAEIIGNLAVNHDVIWAARNQDEESIGKFEKLFYRLAAAVSFATDGPALLSAVKVALLPSGG